MDDFEILNILVPLFIFGVVGFLNILNGLRYIRYNKIVILTGYSPPTHKEYAIISIILGAIFNIMVFLLGISFFDIRGDLLFSLGIGFQIAFFYWYWYTKDDPLNRFHYEQKIWEDPRDKKKQEPK